MPKQAKVGRPTKWDAPGTELIINDICNRVSLGETLNEVCRDQADFGYPPSTTFRLWVMNDTPPGIAVQYARARELQWESWADMIVDDSAKSRIGEQTETDASGNIIKVKTGDTVDRSRLAVDAKKWILSKLAPKRYGERTHSEITGLDGGPLTVSWLPPQGT